MLNVYMLVFDSLHNLYNPLSKKIRRQNKISHFECISIHGMLYKEQKNIIYTFSISPHD